MLMACLGVQSSPDPHFQDYCLCNWSRLKSPVNSIVPSVFILVCACVFLLEGCCGV